MIRNLTLVTSLLTLTVAGASAQSRHAIPSIPFHPAQARVSATDFQQKLHRITRTAHGSSGAMFKTTSGGERLIAQASYDFSNVPTGEMQDTLFLKYSGNRTSAFDFNNLQYDFGNRSDAPGPYSNTGYVHFDTGRAYTGTSPDGYAFRTYNANGKIARTEFENAIQLFSYDAQGKLVQILTIAYNSTSGTFTDSSSRDFYTYNAAGHLQTNSTEYWNTATSAWEPGELTTYTPNSAGNPVQAVYTYYSPAPVVYLQEDFVYDVANNVTLITTKYDDGNGTLVDSYKDSLGYSANMRVLHRMYEWNTTASSWNLSYEEKRHLNAASLPDSILSRQIYNGIIDTAIGVIAYNAQGNPINLRYFTPESTTQQYELRWYYQSQNGVGVTGITAKKDLSVYPNPASDILYLKGEAEGRYSIQNMAGQILQAGTLNAATGLPVSTLAAGVYSLSLQGKDGVVRTTQFIRQ